MNMSESIDALAEALASAQAVMEQPNKDREVEVQMKKQDGSNGGKYKFKYATLDNIIATVRPALADNGLAFLQFTAANSMVTRLLHKSGQFMDCAIPMPSLPAKPQEAGSVISYFKRYSLCAALGIVADEDDEKNVAIEHDAAPGPAWPEGPYTSKSALKAAWKALVRDLNSAGSAQEVEDYIDRDKDMLAQFRAAARLNIDDLRQQYQGHGDFVGVADEISKARNKFVCVADAPREPGPPAGMPEDEVTEATKALIGLVGRCNTGKDFDELLELNAEYVETASEANKNAIRKAITDRKNAIRAARNPINAG
jgi:hypothetical protein